MTERKNRSAAGPEPAFSHLDGRSRLRMVDVGGKSATARTARAAGCVRMSAVLIERLQSGETAKGNVFTTAQAAGILAAKRTAELIPLCHPLVLDQIEIDFELGEDRVEILANVRLTGRTGAEMEALIAVAVAALTIYDMCKAIDKGMVIDEVRLLEKTGGKSGPYRRRTDGAG